MHVGDVLCCGQGSVFEDRVRALKESFPFGSWKSLQDTETFCGCELRQLEAKSIDLNQERSAEGISEIPITKSKKEQLRSMKPRENGSGQLLER